MKQINHFAIAIALATFGFAVTGGVQAAAQAIKAEESAVTQGGEASIAFVNRGGVRDWQAVGDDKLYIQDSQGKWYLATLATSSPGLSFATAIGFETRGADRLDKFGAVVVTGTRYPLSSLVASSAPPPKAKK